MNADGKVYLASTSTTFLGFSESSATINQSVIVDVSGITNTLTSLSIGSKYYLTNQTIT
jgi:hypothetical protein